MVTADKKKKNLKTLKFQFSNASQEVQVVEFKPLECVRFDANRVRNIEKLKAQGKSKLKLKKTTNSTKSVYDSLKAYHDKWVFVSPEYSRYSDSEFGSKLYLKLKSFKKFFTPKFAYKVLRHKKSSEIFLARVEVNCNTSTTTSNSTVTKCTSENELDSVQIQFKSNSPLKHLKKEDFTVKLVDRKFLQNQVMQAASDKNLQNMSPYDHVIQDPNKRFCTLNSQLYEEVTNRVVFDDDSLKDIRGETGHVTLDKKTGRLRPLPVGSEETQKTRRSRIPQGPVSARHRSFPTSC